jgi:16S rRNA (uracil1498-N3)-methyltransferase
VPLALLIGPEGGFTDQEIDQAIAQGATNVTFGPRTLRTETAGLAALAAIQAILGDLR